MSRIGSDDELRTAVHDAVDDVMARFDLLERVRGGVVRRRRRVQAAGSMAAVVALAAGVGIVSQRHNASTGGDSMLASPAGTRAASIKAPDCSQALGPSAGVAKSYPHIDDQHVVPGTPVIAIVCPIIWDTRPGTYGSQPTIDSHQTVLHGSQLKQVTDALNTATIGSPPYGITRPPLWSGTNKPAVLSVAVIFRYNSGEDIRVNFPLYDNLEAIVQSPSGLTAHFYPQPIPKVLTTLVPASPSP